MQRSTHSISRQSSSVVVVLVFVLLTACARATGAPGATDQAAQAWADRLERQAQAAAAEDAQRQRAYEAYALRLTALARTERLQDSRERANQAWTDRLNGLADHLGTAR
jgi:hypothetical protein